MSVTSLFSIGQSALSASYAQIQTTSNNIANANTTGYSRQDVQLAAAQGIASNVGFFGAGVNVETVTRSYNQFLTGQANSTNSVSSADQAHLNYLNQLEGVFGTQQSGLGYAAGQLLNAFVDVANAPSDSSARQVVLSDANQLSSQFTTAQQQITALQSGVKQDVTTQIATVNQLAQQVAVLNQQISNVQALGQPPNDLLDQRDQLINQIGGYINVTAIPANDGTIGLFVGGGQNLVLGTTANTLVAQSDPYDASKVQVGLHSGIGPDQVVPSAAITGGSIGGMLTFQNSDLTAASAMLGQMATAISGAMNQQQALGLDLNGNAGTPIFSVAPPRTLPASTNSGDAAIGVTVSDASQVQASDYKLTFDGSNYNLVRLSDNQVSPGSPYTPAQLAAGVTVDGMTVQLNAGSAAPGDSFLLQPVSNAASNMQTVLGDPNGIAAAAPYTASVGAGNTGTAAIASLTATSTSYTPNLSAAITFTSNTGAYSYTLSDGTTGSGTWTAGSPISINGMSLQLSGVPKSGDTIAMVPTTAVSSNNGNAQAFFNMATAPIVAGSNVTDAYSNVVAAIGVRVQSQTQAASISSSAASDAETARANDSGVNLDEEASRLMQFQQSYQAAAKILQAAQAIFDTLIQTISAA